MGWDFYADKDGIFEFIMRWEFKGKSYSKKIEIRGLEPKHPLFIEVIKGEGLG